MRYASVYLSEIEKAYEAFVAAKLKPLLAPKEALFREFVDLMETRGETVTTEELEAATMLQYRLSDVDFYSWLDKNPWLTVPKEAIWCATCLDVPAKAKCKECSGPLCGSCSWTCINCGGVACPACTIVLPVKDKDPVGVCQACKRNRGYGG